MTWLSYSILYGSQKMDKYLDSVLLLGGEVNSLLHPAISEVGGEGGEFLDPFCNIRGRRGGGV